MSECNPASDLNFRFGEDAATPIVGVLERKGVNLHGKGEGVYSND